MNKVNPARASTLSEVLLTLIIMGVVLTLTISSLILKTTEERNIISVKKAYSTLKAIERKAIQEHGELQDWYWRDENSNKTAAFFTRYLKDYFDIIKDCGDASDNGCFADEYRYLNNELYNANFNNPPYYKIITSDGIAYAFYKWSDSPPNCLFAIYVDINGKEGPNKWGRDLFRFNVFPTSKLGIKPHGTYKMNGNELVESTSVKANCSSDGQGSYCAAFALIDGKLGY